VPAYHAARSKDALLNHEVSKIEIERLLLRNQCVQAENMKVMIVDDSAEVRRMITSFIGDLVSEFVECGDGCEALAAYAEHRPDLVLMDYEMTRMNGFQATRAIKKDFPEAYIVIVSQWDSEALREAAKDAGADAYINKKSLLPLREFVRFSARLYDGSREKEE